MDIKAHIPQSLRGACERYADRIAEVDAGDGCTTESGFAYDVLLVRGWRTGDDWCHTIIEPTAKRIIEKLRATVPCDCKECRAA